MNRSILVAALGLGVALGAGPLAAQTNIRDAALTSHRTIRIGFGGGVSVPTSNYKDALNAKNGINGQGFILFQPRGFPVGLRATFSYNRFDLDDIQVPGIPGTAADGTSQILAGLANIQVGIGMGPIRPYLLAGLGAFNLKNELDGQSDSESETKFGIDGGAGIALKISRLDAFLEARIANVYTDEGAIDVKSIRFIPVTFGIIF